MLSSYICLQELADKYLQPDTGCPTEADEYSDTDQVQIGALIGLWVILVVAVALAFFVAGCQYLLQRYKNSEKNELITQRTSQLLRSCSMVGSFLRKSQASQAPHGATLAH
jgi:hypothetical protein